MCFYIYKYAYLYLWHKHLSVPIFCLGLLDIHPTCRKHVRLLISSSEKFFLFPMAAWRWDFTEKTPSNYTVYLRAYSTIGDCCAEKGHMTMHIWLKFRLPLVKTPVHYIISVVRYINSNCLWWVHMGISLKEREITEEPMKVKIWKKLLIFKH